MLKSGTKKYRLPIAILFLTIIISSGILAGSGCSSAQPIEIFMPETANPEQITRIYIGGAVNHPGFYPLKPGDSIEDLIQAAGGNTDSADLSQIELYFPSPVETETPQKIDLNRAPAWLLDALPGIGEAKAQAIIDYRNQNGPFNNTNELLKVNGIGEATFNEIKDLITVAD
jgi:competence protein ComEA